MWLIYLSYDIARSTAVAEVANDTAFFI